MRNHNILAILVVLLGIAVGDATNNNSPYRNMRTQECTATDHTVKNLPYWTEATFPCMYAGTFNVSETKDHNLFYWFFKNTTLTDPPLVLWVNGGPGASSMFGLFLENGPLRVKRNGTGVDDYQIGLAVESWGDHADIVFLDQPVGTGFSYGTPLLDRLDEGANETLSFLKKFVEMYPEYKGRKFLITGESYAGKYIPHFARKLQQWNLQNEKLLDLQTLLIGNPIPSPIKQRLTTHNVAQGNNAMDSTMLNQVAALRRRCDETVSTNWTDGEKQCLQTMNYLIDMSGKTYTYDTRIFEEDWDAEEAPVVGYLTSSGKVKELYTSIHVDKSTKDPVYDWESNEVADAYNYEVLMDWSSWYDQVSGDSSNINILVYAGEYDQRDGPTTHEQWVKNLLQFTKNNGALWKQPRQIYYVKNTTGEYIGGYYRYDADTRFTLMTIPQAGHFVPSNNYMATKQFLIDYINDGKLSCHSDKTDNCNSGIIMCNYMGNCSGHGTCSNTTGLCECDAGYKQADCSKKVEMLTDGYTKVHSFVGRQWLYLQFDEGLQEGESFNLTISGSNPVDIIINQDTTQDPNEFRYDMQIKKKAYTIISSTAFPTLQKFIIAIRVHGFDTYSNTIYNSQVRVSFSKSSPAQTQAVEESYLQYLKHQFKAILHYFK